MRSKLTLTPLRVVIFFVLLCVRVSAAEWIDVTDAFVANPRYENNSKEGWTVYSGSWYDGYNVRVNAMEMWYAYFRLGQEVSDLPNGKYRISVNAYYRPGDFDSYAAQNYSEATAQRDAYIFANGNTQKIKSIYSEYTNDYHNGDSYYRDADYNYYFYPNNMEGASARFAAGAYSNSLEFNVTDGTLSFGMACPDDNGQRIYHNWTIWSNWKLEFYGNLQPVTAITFSPSSYTVERYSTRQLTPTVQPSTATIKKLKWESSDESVATVDESGLVTGTGAGKCTITASAIDGSGKWGSCTVTVTSNPATKDNVFINEIQTRNVDMFIDPSYNYGGWIELYNPSAKSVDLAGVIIRDDLRGYETRLSMDYGAIPAGGYKNVWFDHYDGKYGKWAYKQVDWKLDTDGGTVSVFSREGELLATQTFPSLKGRTSYARKTDGTGAWAVTAEPTPEATNATSAFVTTQISAPTVDRQSGLFTSPFTFTVTYPSDATLIYTTDGSTPTLSNGTRLHSGRCDGHLPLPPLQDGYDSQRGGDAQLDIQRPGL